MTIKKLVLFSALSVALVAGGAAAQSGVSVSVSPVTAVIPQNVTQANLGSITVTGPTGVALNSLPITITPGTTATSTASLNDCQLYNSAGTSVTTGSNVVNPTGGANTYTLNNQIPLGGSSATTLTLRCDSDISTPAGATFSFSVGTPGITVTQQPTQHAALVANLNTAPSVPRGASDIALANIYFGASATTSARVTAVPVTVSAANGASVTHLSDCRIRDASNLSGSLSGSINPISSGATVFTLSNPAVVSAGGTETLSFTCDVSSAAPIGGTFSVSIAPSTITATNFVTGGPLAVSTATGTGPGGQPISTSGTVVVSGESSGNGGTGNGTGTPGVPNTGLGSNGMILALVLAGIVALMGSLYLARTRLS